MSVINPPNHPGNDDGPPFLPHGSPDGYWPPPVGPPSPRSSQRTHTYPETQVYSMQRGYPATDVYPIAPVHAPSVLYALAAPPHEPPPPPAVLPEAPKPPLNLRLKRWALAAVALSLIAISIAADQSQFMVVPVLLLLVVPFEKLFPRHQQPLRRPQVGTDIGYALAGHVLTGASLAAAVVVGVVSLAWLPVLLSARWSA